MAEGKWKSIKQFMCCDKRRKIGYADEFFDFEEFNELKAEAKKKEAPRKKKEEKQKKKSAPKTVYKLPLTLKSIAGDLVMTEGTGTEEEVKQFLAEQAHSLQSVMFQRKRMHICAAQRTMKEWKKEPSRLTECRCSLGQKQWMLRH